MPYLLYTMLCAFFLGSFLKIRTFEMRTSNGQTACLNGKKVESVNNSGILKSLNSVEEEFLGYVKFHGLNSFIKSLKLIHDISLYHSDYPIDEHEKVALHDLKILLEGFERWEKS